MYIAPLKQERQVVKYDALGMQHTAYCAMDVHYELIEWTVGLIAPTAVVTNVFTDLVSDVTLNSQDLDKIISFHNKCKSYES